MSAASRKIFLHLSPLAVVGGCEANALLRLECRREAERRVSESAFMHRVEELVLGVTTTTSGRGWSRPFHRKPPLS